MNFSSQLQYDRLAKIRATMKERRENTNNFTKKVSENVKKTIDDTDDTFMDPVNTDTNLNTKNSREIGGFILDDDILGEPTCPDIEKNPVNRKMGTPQVWSAEVDIEGEVGMYWYYSPEAMALEAKYQDKIAPSGTMLEQVFAYIEGTAQEQAQKLGIPFLGSFWFKDRIVHYANDNIYLLSQTMRYKDEKQQDNHGMSIGRGGEKAYLYDSLGTSFSAYTVLLFKKKIKINPDTPMADVVYPKKELAK